MCNLYDRERERVCVCVCDVYEREREREKESVYVVLQPIADRVAQNLEIIS